MMHVSLIAEHHHILTVQVTVYGFLEPRKNLLFEYTEPVYHILTNEEQVSYTNLGNIVWHFSHPR